MKKEEIEKEMFHEIDVVFERVKYYLLKRVEDFKVRYPETEDVTKNLTRDDLEEIKKAFENIKVDVSSHLENIERLERNNIEIENVLIELTRQFKKRLINLEKGLMAQLK